MSSKISFKELYFLSIHGLSSRKIGEMCGLSGTTVVHQQKKYGICEIRTTNAPNMSNYKFDKIDSPEKAYALGFILADSFINEKNIVEISIAMGDKSVVDFISDVIGGNVSEDYTFNRRQRRFPRCRTSRKITDITRFTGGRKKKERHYPRVKKDLERYLLLGFFDGDGCVTWGKRKDRNRLWHKIAFTSSYSILCGLQQFLFKLGISTQLRPRQDGDCFVLEFSNKLDILKFLNYIYPNEEFIILQRKYLKANALRLELEEFGETTNK